MKHSHDVLVIGTEPPCPRCDLMVLLVKQVAENSSVEVNLRHCAYDSPEAKDFGREVGRKIGTGKHVSQAAYIDMDWDSVYREIKRRKEKLPSDCRPADTWSSELDRLLMPCARAADAAGYLMTPILIVDGKVVHHGSVPTGHQVSSWLSE
jgi:hypothetical protein